MQLTLRAALAVGVLLSAAALTGTATAQRVDPLPAEQVFRFNAAMDGGFVVAVYQLPDGIYLYRDKLLLTTTTKAVTLSPPTLPAAMIRDDEFFGRVSVYYGGVTLRAAVAGDGVFTLVAVSQGCDEQVGICYPPQQHMAVLAAATPAGGGESGGGAYNINVVASDATSAARALADNNLLYLVALFFILGVGLSLTPCVLPMLPILGGIIGGGDKPKKRVFALTAAYIAGVVAAFTAFGVAAAYAGQLLAAFLQKPPVLIVTALLLTALALSLFGLYSLQLPSFLRRQRQHDGMVATFFAGAAASLIVSPCVSAPLIGALLYISQTGDVAIGAFALMALALGMSVLLAVAGVAGGHLLPKAGVWTVGIQRFFGWLLLLVAVWTAAPALPPTAVMALYAVLLLFGGVMTKPLRSPQNAAVALLAVKAAGLAAIVWGVLMLAGAAGGGRDPLRPLDFLLTTTPAATTAAAPLTFLPVRTTAEFDDRLANTDRPVMLEFYADWCVTCKEMEYFTFSDARVKARLQNTLLLRADVTDNTAEQQALLRRFNVFGPPAILFFGKDGAPGGRVDGYQNTGDFLATLDNIKL